MPISRQRVTATLFASEGESFWGTRGHVRVTLPLAVFPERPAAALETLRGSGWDYDAEKGCWARDHDGRRQLLLCGTTFGSVYPDALDMAPNTLLREDADSAEWFEASIVEEYLDVDGKERYCYKGELATDERIALILLENWASRYAYGVLTDGLDWNRFLGLPPIVDSSRETLARGKALRALGLSTETVSYVDLLASLDPLAAAHIELAGDAQSVSYAIEGDKIFFVYSFKVRVEGQRRAFGRSMTALLKLAEESGVEHRFSRFVA
jgi:hypothetical protein